MGEAREKSKQSDRLVNFGGNGINFLDGRVVAVLSECQVERASMPIDEPLIGVRGADNAGRPPRVFGGA